MASARIPVLAAGLLIGGAAGLVAHERLRVNESTPLHWSNPAAVGIVINSTGSSDIADGSHETALRMAIQAWNDAEGSDFTLVENTDPAQQARTDWAADNIHLILYDETNESGFFGGGGIVAVTPVWFFMNGQIVDADVLFNGAEFMFTTSGEPGRFDVGDVGAHELGHLVGLDHSGWAGATMYPYVDPGVVLQRSLSLDEIVGARDIFSGTPWGSITGTVRRASDGSPVVGAHVVARDADGRTAASVLSRSNGTFAIPGLAAGSYTVYADPLDAPVSAAELGTRTIETDFETTISGVTATVPAGGDFALGDLTVGADVVVNLGSNFDAYPLRAIRGQTVLHTVRGSQLAVGCTLTASDPDVVLSSVLWFGNSVTFQVTVPGAEPAGHVDLAVTTAGGELNILPGALEITPPTPTVTSVAPAVGPKGGGTALTLTGTSFHPGARVVIGDRIYKDGAPGGCVVVDPTTIVLTTLATVEGTHDVVVVDSTGVDGRLVDGYVAAALPGLTSIFPPSGDSAGGTEIILTGTDFAAGLVVRIDGVEQSTVIFDDDTRVRVVTDGGTPGGPYALELENPGGGLATGAFVYVNQPDPAITTANPSRASVAGGDVITLSGANFPADATVTFGANPDTGLGGVQGLSVLVLDANTLEVTTPAHAKGTVSVFVQDASSAQAATHAGFKFGSNGGGGGGCSIDAVTPPSNGPRAIALGGWWIALLSAATLLMRRGPRVARPVRA
jgi:hypothetical protein